MTEVLFGNTVTELTKCKGRVYRFLQSMYIGKKGELVAKTEFRPLKKDSCPGCEHCNWIEDDLQEGIACDGSSYIVMEKGIKHGDKVRLSVQHTSTDPETGQVDGWNFIARKLKEDKKCTTEKSPQK